MSELKEKSRMSGVEEVAERDEVLERVLARREEHRQRSVFVRAAVVVGGGLLSVFAALLSVITPEFGLPLLLVGLRILALEFDWAARLYTKVAKLARRVTGRIKKMWARSKVGVILGAVVIVALVVYAVTTLW